MILPKAIVVILFAACASNDPMPDAMPLNPTGGWKLALVLAADSCGHPTTDKTVEVTVTCNATVPATNCTVIPFATPTTESVLPGARMTCTLDNCDASFTFDWNDATGNHAESYDSAHFTSAFVTGAGNASFNSGSQGCLASFSFAGQPI